ncbi:MAG: hypothetical protein HKO02_03915 [Hyphomonadaceae bacterium]|nr:hypothetical protein [Hyphomonadaceae bacterium]
MSDEPENGTDNNKPKQPTVKIVVEKASATVDKANTTMENASNVMSTIKWVAMAIVALAVLGGGYGIYKMVSAPARVVGNAAESVTDVAKAGTDKVKDATSEVMNRLVVPTTDQESLNRLSEIAFAVLTEMEPTEPNGIKDRMFRRKLGGHEGRICELNVDFGGGEIPVFVAADNEEFSTSKALGAKDDRLMRMVIRLPEDDIIFNAEWETDAGNWVAKWKATTVKKPIGDEAAEQNIHDILRLVPQKC